MNKWNDDAREWLHGDEGYSPEDLHELYGCLDKDCCGCCDKPKLTQMKQLVIQQVRDDDRESDSITEFTVTYGDWHIATKYGLTAAIDFARGWRFKQEEEIDIVLK